MRNMIQGDIYISYAHGDESEAMAGKVEAALKAALQGKDFNVKRDIKILKYRDDIVNFEHQLGQGNSIVTIISDKYLKSLNCMSEMLFISKKQEMEKRIFPIVMEDATGIYKPRGRLVYLNYWKKQRKQFAEDLLQDDITPGMESNIADLIRFVGIERLINDVNDLLKRMNALTVAAHSESNFTDLIRAIKSHVSQRTRSEEPPAGPPVAPSPSVTLRPTVYGTLSVSSRTAGELYLNGTSIGHIPAGAEADVDSIPVGTHQFEMRYDGSQTERKSVTVQEGHALSVSFAYEEIEGYVFIEGGRFTMGSPSNESGRFDNEKQHQVTVSDFYMSKYEVTQREWSDVKGSNLSDFKGDNLPEENVSWFEAVEFCNALSRKAGRTPVYRISGKSVTANFSANGYRLPTEAEWEYAARGGKKSLGYQYAGGNSPGVGWYDDNSGGKTHPVGGKAANELGLYDMSGNVYEWCWDWYGGDDYGVSPQTDPTGAESGSNRVARGGGWYSGGRRLRSAYRDFSSPSSRSFSLGLRLVWRT